MPTIILTNMSPRELLDAAIGQANEASREITELASSPFEPGETQLDRALLVARHAFKLAEAWTVIDMLAHHDFESSLPSSQPSERRGVSPKETTN